MNTTIYPEDYNDELKAVYDDLYSRGLQLLGKKIKPQDEFLIDLSVKITINKMRGISNDLSVEEVEEIKKTYMEKMNGGEYETAINDD